MNLNPYARSLDLPRYGGNPYGLSGSGALPSGVRRPPAPQPPSSLGPAAPAAPLRPPTLPAAPMYRSAMPSPIAGPLVPPQGGGIPAAGAAVRTPAATPITGALVPPAAPDPEPYRVSNQVSGVNTSPSAYDEGPLTEQGRAYASRLLGDINTADNPYVRSIREGAERQADKNTYSARSQAEEALGVSGVQAGTSQYNRAVSKAAAGANAANRDVLNASAGAARSFYQDAMGRVRDYEDTMYGRAKGQRDVALDIAKYGDDRADKQRSSDEATRLERKGDALAYINSISDPKARAAARNLYEQGKDPRTAGIYDSYGGINEPYRSATPGQVDVEGLFDRIRAAYTGQVNPKTGAAWTEAEMRAEAARLYGQGLENEFRPLQQGATAADVEAIKQKQALGQPLTPAEQDTLVKSGDTQSFSTPAQLPQDNANQKLMVGKTIRVGQTNYKVVNTGSTVTSRTWYNAARHTDYMVLQDGSGNVVYAYGGQIHQTPPQEGPGGRYGFMETR